MAPKSTFIAPLLLAFMLFIDPPIQLDVAMAVKCCRTFSRDTERRFLTEPCFERFPRAGLFEQLRNLQGCGYIGGQRLDAQAAIQIRSQQSADPAQVFARALHAIFAAPKRDNRHEPRFVVCDHYKTSGESGNFSERSVDRLR